MNFLSITISYVLAQEVVTAVEPLCVFLMVLQALQVGTKDILILLLTYQQILQLLYLHTIRLAT